MPEIAAVTIAVVALIVALRALRRIDRHEQGDRSLEWFARMARRQH